MTINTLQVNHPLDRPKRPFGVNAIIVLSTLSVVYSIAAVVVFYFGTPSAVPSLVERWLMVYLIGGSVVQIVGVIGLWQLKRWGWFLIMIRTGAGMFLNIWAYFYAQPSYVAMLASVLIVLYLNQSEVQQAFPTEPQGPPQ